MRTKVACRQDQGSIFSILTAALNCGPDSGMEKRGSGPSADGVPQDPADAMPGTKVKTVP
jgi:hypothetical protein